MRGACHGIAKFCTPPRCAAHVPLVDHSDPVAQELAAHRGEKTAERDPSLSMAEGPGPWALWTRTACRQD